MSRFSSLSLTWLMFLTVPVAHAEVADLQRGETLYGECKGCHDLRENMMGPRHCWLIGRGAGKVPGFIYSNEMKTSGLMWNDKTLDEFLTMPLTFLPGTNMGYAGLDRKEDRYDLIAYLKLATSDSNACAGVDRN